MPSLFPAGTCNSNSAVISGTKQPLLFLILLVQIRNGLNFWFEGTSLEDWIDNLSRPGLMVDHYWLSAAAKMLGRCIVLIPSFVQSSTHIGRIIRVWGGKSTAEHPETAGVQLPLFLGYMEDNLYTGPVF